MVFVDVPDQGHDAAKWPCVLSSQHATFAKVVPSMMPVLKSMETHAWSVAEAAFHVTV